LEFETVAEFYIDAEDLKIGDLSAIPAPEKRPDVPKLELESPRRHVRHRSPKSASRTQRSYAIWSSILGPSGTTAMIDQNFLTTIQTARLQLLHIRQALNSARKLRLSRESALLSFT
jgi:hypothetical protein